MSIAMMEFAKAAARRHEDARDEAVRIVTRGFAGLQPATHDLCNFADATVHGYAVEAWAQVVRAQDINTVMMSLNGWATNSTTYGHPIAAYIQTVKRSVAQDVVETLTKEGYLDHQNLRVFLIGIWGIEEGEGS